jgi:hypothetical protein
VSRATQNALLASCRKELATSLVPTVRRKSLHEIEGLEIGLLPAGEEEESAQAL